MENYLTPELEIIFFNSEDVITTSTSSSKSIQFPDVDV